LNCDAEKSSTFVRPQPSRSARSTYGKPDAARSCRKRSPLVPSSPRPLVPSSPRPLVPASPTPFYDRPIKPTKRFGSTVAKSLSATFMEGRRVSFFRTLSSRAVRLNPYTASRRQHGCAERHHPSSPRPQLHNSQLLSMIDRPTDRPTHRPTDPPTHRPADRSNRQHGSEVADMCYKCHTFAEAHGAGVDRFDRSPVLNLFPTWPTRTGRRASALSALLLSTRLVEPDAPQAWTLARTTCAGEFPIVSESLQEPIAHPQSQPCGGVALDSRVSFRVPQTASMVAPQMAVIQRATV
jgi:hypothetical protein